MDGKPIPPPTTPEPPPPPPPPAVPGSLMVSASGEDFIEWNWAAIEGADGYEVHFSAGELFPPIDETIGLTAEALSYRRENLPAKTSANLRVRSVTGTGEGRITSLWSVPVTGNTTTPDSPHREHHAALTAGLPERPFANASLEGHQDTVGTLRLGLNPGVFPVIVMPGETGLSVLVAASRLGDARVVAFSGTDFLSLEEPGLLGNESVDRLLANAVRWTANDNTTPLRVVADSQEIADALVAEGLDGVEVVGRGPDGFVRDWSTSALRNADVAVVVVNHRWGARLVEGSVAPLRGFVERGGGLVVAGSALHWSWFIEQHQGPFRGNLLLQGTGIAWNEDRIAEIRAATTDGDPQLTPSVAWGRTSAAARRVRACCPVSSIRRSISAVTRNWTRRWSGW